MKSLSYSSLSTFNSCPLQFYRVKKLESLGLRGHDNDMKNVRGKLVHKFMEDLVNNRIQDGDWMSEVDAANHMDKLWTDGFPWDEDESVNIMDTIDWDQPFLIKSAEDSQLLVPQIYDEILPRIEPTGAEVHMELDLPKPGKIYTKLRGVVDLTTTTNDIYDWKTSTSQRQAPMSPYDLQATVYATLSGQPRVNVHFVQFIFLKTKEPRIEWETARRDTRHQDWLLNTYIPAVIKIVEQDEEPAATPGWQCMRCPTPCDVNPDIGGQYERLLREHDRRL